MMPRFFVSILRAEAARLTSRHSNSSCLALVRQSVSGLMIVLYALSFGHQPLGICTHDHHAHGHESTLTCVSHARHANHVPCNGDLAVGGESEPTPGEQDSPGDGTPCGFCELVSTLVLPVQYESVTPPSGQQGAPVRAKPMVSARLSRSEPFRPAHSPQRGIRIGISCRRSRC